MGHMKYQDGEFGREILVSYVVDRGHHIQFRETWHRPTRRNAVGPCAAGLFQETQGMLARASTQDYRMVHYVQEFSVFGKEILEQYREHHIQCVARKHHRNRQTVVAEAYADQSQGKQGMMEQG
tara:strand:+ start:466 stop:837 length:372 start_codon:yes stop_codon:yes gene_type:complete